MKVIGALVIFVLLVLTMVSGTTVFAASDNKIAGAPNAVDHSYPSADSIPPGTIITTQNWQSYRQFMPDGMAAMFEGKYFWKMPPDVQMEVGPTMIVPLPKNYLAATEKYADQVKVIELPDGGLTLQGYRGGIAFPNPQEPHRGCVDGGRVGGGAERNVDRRRRRRERAARRRRHPRHGERRGLRRGETDARRQQGQGSRTHTDPPESREL